MFTLDVCVCVCVCVERHRQFNIALMEMQTHMHRMGLNPFLTFYLDAMLNFDGDVDANANDKCEHTIRLKVKFLQNQPIVHGLKYSREKTSGFSRIAFKKVENWQVKTKKGKHFIDVGVLCQQNLEFRTLHIAEILVLFNAVQ